jgi:hypothetical protein
MEVFRALAVILDFYKPIVPFGKIKGKFKGNIAAVARLSVGLLKMTLFFESSRLGKDFLLELST